MQSSVKLDSTNVCSFIHSLDMPIINHWSLQSTIFNRKLMNTTTQTVQSPNGITINPIQKNSVFIHSVPNCILGARWTESSARPMCAVWHEYQSFSRHVKAEGDGSDWDSTRNAIYRGLEDVSNQYVCVSNVHRFLNALTELFLILKPGKCLTSMIEKSL